MHPRRVYKHHLSSSSPGITLCLLPHRQLQHPLYARPRRLRLMRNDRQLLPQQCIQQRRLTCIRAANNRDETSTKCHLSIMTPIQIHHPRESAPDVCPSPLAHPINTNEQTPPSNGPVACQRSPAQARVAGSPPGRSNEVFAQTLTRQVDWSKVRRGAPHADATGVRACTQG
jgi:hypothetical protein